MNWKSLLNNRCPKCNKELDHQSDFEYMLCDISCGFQISVQRMKEICGDQVKYRIENDNQDKLNSLKTVDNYEEDDLQDISDLL